MPNIATINGIDEDDIATHNGITAANVASKGGDTWEHLTAFGGGNQSATDLKTFFDTNFINSFAVNSPTAGGNLTLNGQNCGPYDYVLKRSDITLSSTPTSSDWFTTTKDTRSAIIGVAGNLTINSGAFLRPPDRKLFMAIYVDGNLTINSIYKIYSDNFIPELGKNITDNKEAYKYLVESIKRFPAQEEICKILKLRKFYNIDYYNLNFGIAVIYSCRKK